MKTSLIRYLSAVVLLTVMNQPLVASDFDVEGGAKQPLTLGLGLMYKDKPYDNYSSNDKTNIVPLVLYEGQHFFARGNSIGWNFLDSNELELAVIGELVGEGYESGDSRALTGMSDRDPSLFIGGQLTWKQEKLGLKLTAITDLSDESDGTQIRGGVFYLERQGNLVLRPFATLIWQDEEFNDYYYGVRAMEATATRAAYNADSDLNFQVGLTATHQAQGSPWMVFGSAQYVWFGDEISDSSIVENDDMLVALLGVGYTFR